MGLLRVVGSVLALGVAGCGDCLSYAGGAFLVNVSDARTGAPIASGATLVARGTGGADSVTYPLDGDANQRSMVLFEGFLGPGVYTVEVRRPGYMTWSRSNVRLRAKDDCGHVTAVHIEAPLQPVSSQLAPTR